MNNGQSQELEFVYAEIKHHLDNVLADETITTIIQMLKDYPQVKEKLERIDNYVNSHSWVDSVLQYHDEGNFAKFHNQLKLILKATVHSFGSGDKK